MIRLVDSAVTAFVSGLHCAVRDGSDVEKKQHAYAMARAYLERFAAWNKTCECRALLDCDISTPEDLQQANNAGLFQTLCPRLVQDAAEILLESIGKETR